MSEWNPDAAGGVSVDIGQFEIMITPNRPLPGWHCVITVFSHVIYRLNRETVEDAKRDGLYTLAGLLDGWKWQAIRARQELDEVT